MLQQEFGERDLEIHLNRIKDCLQRRHLITVYELDDVGGMDIDGAILHALLKGWLHIYFLFVIFDSVFTSCTICDHCVMHCCE